MPSRLHDAPLDIVAYWSLLATASRQTQPMAQSEGMILNAPRGTGGFGYDPLFYLPQLDRTMAEIDLQTKLSISHRGRAFAALLAQLHV